MERRMAESAPAPTGMSEAGHSPAAPRAIPWFTAFLVLATLALSILVIVLARHNRQLRAETNALRQLAGDSALFPGEILASLDSFGPATESTHDDVAQDALTLVDGRPGTILLLSSGACGACETVMPRFAALAARHGASGVACYAIQIDARSPTDLTHTNWGTDLGGVQVRGVPGAERSWLRRIPLIPSIVILDHEGALVRGFYGAPDDNQWKEIEREVGRLSGMDPLASPPP